MKEKEKREKGERKKGEREKGEREKESKKYVYTCASASRFFLSSSSASACTRFSSAIISRVTIPSSKSGISSSINSIVSLDNDEFDRLVSVVQEVLVSICVSISMEVDREGEAISRVAPVLLY